MEGGGLDGVLVEYSKFPNARVRTANNQRMTHFPAHPARALIVVALHMGLVGVMGHAAVEFAWGQQEDPSHMLTAPASQPTQPAQPVQQVQPLQTQQVASPAATGLTLANLDASGNIVRYPEGPEEAAIKLLTLTPEERAKVEAVVAKRHADVDAHVRKHLPLVMRIQGVKEEGLTQDRVNAFREFGREFSDIRLRQEYRNAIVGTLSATNGQNFAALTSGYRRAWINLSQARAREQAKQDALIHHTNMESFTTATEEVRQSVDRQIGESNQAIMNAVQTLALSPGQQPLVQAVADEFASRVTEAGDISKVAPEQKVAHVRNLLNMVMEDQRRALLTAIFAERAAAALDK